ncbi:MAG: helix-turn-helix domain-containing protein [Nitrospinae bacterium]|nr:helix-turn-helix domain-containing protein [Nitrospinota bacterium]
MHSATSGRNSGIRQDPERLQRVIDLFNEGKTYQTIADELDVTMSRIQQIIRRLSREGLVTGFPRKRGRPIG